MISGFPQVPQWFRDLFPYSKWGAEINAKLTLLFFNWLVGPMEIVEAEVNGEKQMSQVHIKQCRSKDRPYSLMLISSSVTRYLHESGCVGMCVNLCKAPCQTFFTEQLGMPLTMNPSKMNDRSGER